VVTKSEGVNVVGYHRQSLGLGAEARRVVGALRSAGVPVATIDAPGSNSPILESVPASDNEWRYSTTLSVVAGDQLPPVVRALGRDYFSRGPHIGLWYWELERVNHQMRHALSLVDRLVAGSDFVWRVLVRETYHPVFRLPLTRPVLSETSYTREYFRLPKNRLLYLCTFDFFSVIARKNPIGVIEAFKKAFTNDEGPILIVKSQNGDKFDIDFDSIKQAIGSRSDIRLVDKTFTDDEQSSLIRCVDLVVSLHRAEGLGLHLLEAILRGVPVLATLYSAPWEFMDQSYALPIDYGLAPVQNGNGVYPEGTLWAEPDIEHAAAQMRRFADSEDLRLSMARCTLAVEDHLTTDVDAGTSLYEWLVLGGAA
jgi:glycosyltransferase involved in cell wall biosynthesis